MEESMEGIIEQVTEFLFVKGASAYVFRPPLGKAINDVKANLLTQPKIKAELEGTKKTGWSVSNLKWEHISISEQGILNRILLDVTSQQSTKTLKVLCDISYSVADKATKTVIPTMTWI